MVQRTNLDKSMNKKVIILIVMIAVCTTTAMSQSRVGTTAASFLTLGAGARGTSLGHAYTAIATGPDALFWNPGGSARAYNGEHRGGVLFSQNKWIADIDYSAVGVVLPITSTGVVGLSLATVDYGRMEVRTVTQPEGTGQTFGARDLSVGLSYAMPLTPSFFFGGTAKLVNQKIRDMSASTIAFDFGFVLVTEYLNGATIAASIMNFGGKMRMDGVNSEITVDIDPQNTGSSESIPARLRMDAWDLPLAFKFGIAVPAISLSNVEVTVLADANQTNDNNLNSDVGAQFRYFNRTLSFDVRLGYKDVFLDNVDSHFSYGAGLDLKMSGVRFGFDFAYVPFDFLDEAKTFDFRIYF